MFKRQSRRLQNPNGQFISRSAAAAGAAGAGGDLGHLYGSRQPEGSGSHGSYGSVRNLGGAPVAGHIVVAPEMMEHPANRSNPNFHSAPMAFGTSAALGASSGLAGVHAHDGYHESMSDGRDITSSYNASGGSAPGNSGSGAGGGSGGLIPYSTPSGSAPAPSGGSGSPQRMSSSMSSEQPSSYNQTVRALEVDERTDENLQPFNEPSFEHDPVNNDPSYACTDVESNDLSVFELEISELVMPNRDTDGLEQVSPQTRKFSFKRNSQLLLGRAPSCGSDTKARMRQSIEAGHMREQALALNGCDDGLFNNQVVSKIHAALYEMNGQLILEDKQSTHGTYVNEERIQSCTLKNLDRVRLGRDVVRRDVPYVPLEFTVNIKSRTYNNLKSDDEPALVNQDSKPIDEVSQTLDFASHYELNALTDEDETVDFSTSPQEITRLQDNTMDEAPNDVLPISPAFEMDHDYNNLSELAEQRVPAATTNVKKRKRLEYEPSMPETYNPDKKRTALIAAALAGAVVGSIGTIFTLASI
ncbi:hypothetical protein BGX27_010694 [Mortierella sp. AM989]|nr:hypothetical protein BGX27_010694 [Mortierella sp. AM989]